MVKISERLINVVNTDKLKRLRVSTETNGLGQNGEGSGLGAAISPSVDDAPPANRQNLPHLNQVRARNVVSRSVSHWESEPQGTPTGGSVKDAGESEGSLVIKEIEIAPLTGNMISRESGPTSSRCLVTRKLVKPPKRESR